MDIIHIPHLANVPGQSETVMVQERLPDLETLTPIQGEVQVKHCNTYLEVKGWAETIITLTCDRCLQQYNHRLKVKASELIWLQEPSPELDGYLLEREGSLDDLVETLSPDGDFDPQAWIYEQLCLALPQRQLCDQNCRGIDTSYVDEQQPVDRRWASLETLKQSWMN
jgi:uncharacterized protein